MLFGILNRLRQFLNLEFLRIELVFELENFVSELGDFRDLFVNDVELAHTLLQLELNHADLLFFFSDLLLAIFEDILLYIAFFVENTQLVVAVNKLDTHVVS